MKLLDKFTMPNLQTISFKTTRVNLWSPTLEAPPPEFQLSSQETQENGSMTKLITYLLLLLEITLISSALSVPQDQTNTLKSVLKIWWEKSLNIDGELNTVTLVNKSQMFMMKTTMETDQPLLLLMPLMSQLALETDKPGTEYFLK